MRAIRAETFSGYEGLKLVELPKPALTNGKVLVRIAAARRHTAGSYDSLRQVSRLEGAVSPGQRRSGRCGRGRRNGLSGWIARDVLRRLRRF